VINPFLWQSLGSDELLFDNDVRFEGGSLRVRGNAGPLLLFANTGVYVIEENVDAKDPLLLGGQLGGEIEVARDVTFGARGTVYHFFSLDDEFFARAANNLTEPGGTGGNISDGLARRNGSIQVVEGSAFVRLAMVDLFPVLIYGSYAHNFSARSSLLLPGIDREDDAYAVGVFAGDPALFVRLGFTYFYIEANAFPSMYLDSDSLTTDGFPNRKGYRVSIQRQLFEHVDLILKGYYSHRIEGGPEFAVSGLGAHRLRGQADLVFEF
jgi:hypothetical protein